MLRREEDGEREDFVEFALVGETGRGGCDGLTWKGIEGVRSRCEGRGESEVRR